jgi:hypothetical protein
MIQLDELSEDEMVALEAFFTANEGRFGNFAFTDPWDGSQYPNCSVQTDQLELVSLEEMRGRTSLTVVENRG